LKPFGIQHDVKGVVLAHGGLGLCDGGELDEGEADSLLVLEADVLDGPEGAEHFPELVLADLGRIMLTEELRLDT
jgi:hypothetical protein